MIVKNGGYHYPDENLSDGDDHEVKATATDVTHGALIDESEAGSGVTIDVHTTAGKPKVRFSADVGTIVNTIVNNPTIIQQIANPITVIQQNPAPVASTLFPARIDDANVRPPARALAAFGLGYGLPILDEFATTGALYTWQRSNTNPVLGYATTGDVPLDAGDRFVVANTETLGTGQSLYSGIYELLTQGDGVSTYAVIRRTSDANTPATLCTGMVVKIVGAGMAEEGNYFKLTAGVTVVDGDAPTWVLGSYSPTESFELLTGPQLTSQHANNADTLTMSGTGGAGTDMTLTLGSLFVTIAGTPGISSFPAELVTFELESINISGCTGVAVAQAELSIGGGAQIVLGTSPPLPNDTTTGLSFQAAPSSPVAMSPTDVMSLRYFLKYTSSLPISVLLTYSSPSRGTRITVPFQMAIAGASDGDHQHLSRRDQDVASSDPVNPVKADPCHPWNALGPTGRQHATYGTAAFATPIATMPDNSSKVRLALNGDLGGITYTGFLDGDDVDLRIAADSSARTVFNDVLNHTTYPNAASIKLHGSGAGARALTIPANSRVFLRLRLNMTDFAHPTWEQVVMEIS